MVLTVLFTTTFLTFLTFDPGGGKSLPDDSQGWVRNIQVKTVLKPKKCEDGQVIVIVHSHAKNAELRSSQRNAAKINEKNKNLKFVFVVFQDEGSESIVKQEHTEHHDILLGHLEESYHHLIYKHMMALRWVSSHCPNNMMIKMDDDIYVNFPSLLSQVSRNIPVTGDPKWMMGLLQLSLPVLRSAESKWAVSEEDWREERYPDFLSGWCYVASSTAVRLVVEMVETQHNIFWIDDVMMTGVLAPSVGISLISLNSYYTVYSAHLDCCLAREKSVVCGYLVGPSSSPDMVESLAQRDLHCSSAACSRDSLPCNIHSNASFRGEVLTI